MYQRWYYAGSTLIQFSKYAVGVFAYQKMIYYLLTLCMCTGIKLTFNLNIVRFTN